MPIQSGSTGSLIAGSLLALRLQNAGDRHHDILSDPGDYPAGCLLSRSAGSYFVIIGRGVVAGAGGAGEIENASHAFEPEGRSSPSNTP